MTNTPTPDLDFDTVPAGPELDALVAERVMGLNVSTTDLPPYSAADAAALEVFKKLWSPGKPTFSIKYMVKFDGQGMFVVGRSGREWDVENNIGWDKTLALAICRAALKAVGA